MLIRGKCTAKSNVDSLSAEERMETSVRMNLCNVIVNLTLDNFFVLTVDKCL